MRRSHRRPAVPYRRRPGAGGRAYPSIRACETISGTFQPETTMEHRQTDSGTALREKARAFLPGGNFGNVAGDLVIAEGSGGRVRDVAGREYVDFLLGSGPMLVGHRHPEVDSRRCASSSNAAPPSSPTAPRASCWPRRSAKRCRARRRCVSPAAARRPRCTRCGRCGRCAGARRSSNSRAATTA